MSESLFWSLAPEILKLHRHNAYSLFAAGSTIYDAVMVNIDGLYYMWMEKDADLAASQLGILLLEDETEHTRISWIATAREVGEKDAVYQRAFNALKRRLKNCNEGNSGCLVELVPQQGRLTVGNTQDFTILPHDLVRALYPANERMKNFAA